MKNILFVSLLIISLISCNSDNENSNSPSILPSYIGGADELMFVVSDAIYTDELTKDIKKNFVEQYKLLPQAQARLSVSTVKYSTMNSLLKRFINTVFIVTSQEGQELDAFAKSFMTNDEKLQFTDKQQKLFFKENLFAKNQTIAILFVESKKSIIAELEKNKEAIYSHFEKTNLPFHKKVAYINGVNKSLKKQIQEYHQFNFDVPNGYVLAKNEKNFILLRKDEERSTSFLAIDVNYYNAEIPINNLGIEKFNALGENIDGEKEDSYVIADTTLGFISNKIEEGKITTFENAGLWLMENDFVGGGPFINRYIIDNDKNRVIYFSGMLYGPGEKNKKKNMRQFEAIFSSFSFK